MRKEIATSLPRYPVSFGRCCQRRKESKEERREQSKDTKWRARLVTRRATLRIVARSTLTRIERGGRQGEEDDEGGGWAARRANLMGMQCGNFSLDLVLLPFLPPPLPFLPLCPHRGSRLAAASKLLLQILRTIIDSTIFLHSSPPRSSNVFFFAKKVYENDKKEDNRRLGFSRRFFLPRSKKEEPSSIDTKNIL